ncbi:AsmA-like C-terminal region-containing protein [Arcicella lustrica]|uniref:AsmA-like C-terminal region-containing protein n=1 Tax=Arcicella lustrica TaxID=2984196 RepID=A0ABU5SEW4_9BACT|nr:AsmA-like C-terminal region-containing protein [Arcicella sp. DC25W]MEA5425818.1 AsmA-like C-terminal region-containing protein [Arcicella sp. DC25W]
MKKALIILVSIITLFAVVLFAVPFFFKDTIQAKVNEEIQKKVKAKVYYNDFDLSFFKHFPSLTISLTDFGVVGYSPFASDTLIQAKEFSLAADLKSIISGDKVAINSIAIDSPKILVKVLPDGSANYDIYRTDSLQVQQEETKTKSNFNVGIESWKLTNGQITYDDRLKNTFVLLQNITHEGSGNIGAEIYDLTTNTQVEKASISYGGTEYLHDKTLSADMKINIDQAKSKYSFTKNSWKINDFTLNFDGSVAMPDTSNIVLDITYSSPENTFKNLLSLVPNIYTDKFKDVDADGNVQFNGFVKGTMNPTSFPTYAFNLLVENAMFQYPNLPTAVTGINLDFKASNSTNDLNNSVLNIKKFNMNLGKNPINARALIEGLGKSKVDADVVAKIDLQQIGQIFPMKGLEMRGLYSMDLKAKGTYDSLTKAFPQVNAVMSLANGYIKSDQFPQPIQDLNVKANLVNTNAALASTRLAITEMRMVLDGEPFTANGVIENFENYNWDIKAKGKIDLTKMTKIYPLTDMTLKGKIDADIETKGKMSDVKAKRYASLPTSGKATMQNFEFVSKEYPQGVKVTSADMTFTPTAIKVTNAKGFLGTSDFVADGTFTNYMDYALNNGTVKGKMNVKSNKFNVNEWMTDSPKTTTAGGTTQPLQVVEIPKNIELVMDSDIGEALYSQMKMQNIKGALVVGNGAVKMQNVAFQSLGGKFTTSGTYNTSNLAHPLFDFALNLENIEIAQAYQHLNIVKSLMPVAQYLIGNVTSKLQIGGELGQDMMPKINSLTGDGLMKILQATISESNPLVQKLVETTKIAKLKDTKLSNLLMQFEIKDGTFGVKPFDIKFEDYKITASGRHGLTGSMDYNLLLDVPSGKIGEAFGNVFQKWTGKNLQGTDRVKFDLQLGGTLKNPAFGFKGSSTANSLKDVAKATLQAQIDEGKNKVLDQLNIKKDALPAQILDKDAMEAKAKATADSIKKAAADKAKKLLESQKKSVINGLFNKFGKPAKKDTV